MECIWIFFACASWIERLYVWEERSFSFTSLLHLQKSLFVPFSVLIPGQVICVLDSMAIYVFVVCMYVCVVVWCGSSLSFSLDRRGDGGRVAGQQSGWREAGAILQLRRC